MKFEYTGRHMEVTPALKAHVEEQFGRLGHLFNGDALSAHVIIEVERGRHKSEIVLNWKREVLNANTSHDDMYQSLSQTIGKIEKQALKLKKKITDKHQKAVKVGLAAAGDEDVMADDDDGAKRIIDATDYDIKPVSAEEAATILEGEENKFLVFREAGSQRVSVIYKRKDGHYGLIQP